MAGSRPKPKIFVVVGLSNGDEGKGKIVDALARNNPNITQIIRFNGGPNAMHTVIDPCGTIHGFTLFGSGTLVSEVKTHLAKNVLFSPPTVLAEGEDLKRKGISNAFQRLSLDPRCVIITSFHAMITQMLELARGEDCFGTTGMGIGQAVLDQENNNENLLTVGDLSSLKTITKKIKAQREERLEQALQIIVDNPTGKKLLATLNRFSAKELADELISCYHNFASKNGITIIEDEKLLKILLKKSKTGIIFEGAQGALLDYQCGFWPYVTKTRTTIHQVEELLKDYSDLDICRLGVIRSHSYRLGPGPLVTEDDKLLPIFTNQNGHPNPWTGRTRCGWFDLIGARYGLEANDERIDYIALTHVDKISSLETIQLCTRYQSTLEPPETISQQVKYYKRNDRFIITSVTPQPHNKSDELAKFLMQCQPNKFMEFTLENKVKDFLNFIQSSSGLNTPIGLISIGPTAKETSFNI